MRPGDDSDEGPIAPEAIYARYAGVRHDEARARAAAARVVAALGDSRDDERAAPTDPAAHGSPEALYRRYRASRTELDGAAVPAATVDAIMGALRAESAFDRAAAAPGGETGAARDSREGAAAERASADPPARSAPSALGALFRWPGAALDRATGALGELARGAGARRAVPALALAAAAFAVVPFVLRDAADPVDGADGAVALVPASLLERADALPASAYAPDASAGVGFAGADPFARGYRTGVALTDLVLASRGGEAGRELAVGALRFESGADEDPEVARAVDALAALAAPDVPLGELGAAAHAVRAALAGDDPDVAARVDLGRAVESVRIAAVLAYEHRAVEPLEAALDALAGLPPPSGPALPSSATAALEALVGFAARDALRPVDGIEIGRAADRLRLLLG